jgi:hypothetical protein
MLLDEQPNGLAVPLPGAVDEPTLVRNVLDAIRLGHLDLPASCLDAKFDRKFPKPMNDSKGDLLATLDVDWGELTTRRFEDNPAGRLPMARPFRVARFGTANSTRTERLRNVLTYANAFTRCSSESGQPTTTGRSQPRAAFCMGRWPFISLAI